MVPSFFFLSPYPADIYLCHWQYYYPSGSLLRLLKALCCGVSVSFSPSSHNLSCSQTTFQAFKFDHDDDEQCPMPKFPSAVVQVARSSLTMNLSDVELCSAIIQVHHQNDSSASLASLPRHFPFVLQILLPVLVVSPLLNPGTFPFYNVIV